MRIISQQQRLALAFQRKRAVACFIRNILSDRAYIKEREQTRKNAKMAMPTEPT
jgi:hypothetical protein